MAPKPCVSQHFRDFGQNDGNEEIPCPKRGAEQTFQRSAHQENLVPGNLCFTAVFASKIQLFTEMDILRDTRKTIFFSNAPGIENWKIVDPGNCLMKNNFFFKRFGNDSQ